MPRYQLALQDWVWIVGFLLAALALSVYHARRSAQSLEAYFVAGRQTPWWILGTSIVATTFAADTPLVVSGLVMTQGIAGNWIWWAVLPSGMLGVFFFAALWRRSGCLTQAEFAAIRYGSRRADILRIFYVFYHAVLRNAVTLGFVNLAMAKIVTQCTALDQWKVLAACFVITVVYTILGGINGVMWTDFLQFILAIAMACAVAYCAVAAVGGLDSLRRSPALLPAALDYVPGRGTVEWSAFVILITIYWASCTPTDCNGYAVQRLLCARNEAHAVWGYLWFNFAHYVLRCWPWVLVGLCALKLFGPATSAAQAEHSYIRTLLHTVPRWMIGPALASLVAAYMSTVDTHLNWSASYVVNDFYRPYLKPDAPARHYVRVSRMVIVAIAVAGTIMTYVMTSIVQGWGMVSGLLAGMGVVGVLRWLWWRITAWSELGCMSGAGVATLVMHRTFPEMVFPSNLLVIVPCALLGAVLGTYGCAPEPRDVLLRFVERVRPPGPGWRSVRGEGPAAGDPGGLLRPAGCWLVGSASVYCAMFGLGDVLLKSAVRGGVLCGLAVLGAVAVGLMVRTRGGPAPEPAERAA